MKRLQERLKRIRMFEGLKPSQLRILAGFFTPEHHARGGAIFEEGQTGHSLYLILSGHVRIEHTDNASRRRNVLAILGPGDCFGEIAVVSEFNRTAAARAVDETKLLVIDDERFLEVFRQYPEIARNILKAMAVKLYEANRMIEGLIFRNLEARLAAKIFDLSEKFGEAGAGGAIRINMRLTQSDLAELMGTNRETITRIISVFRKEGSIDYAHQSLIITDAKLLRTWIQ